MNIITTPLMRRNRPAARNQQQNAVMDAKHADAEHASNAGMSAEKHHMRRHASGWFDTGFLGFGWLSKATALMLAVMTAVMLAMAVFAPYDYAADDSWKVNDYRGGHAAYIWWMSDNHLFEVPSWDTRIVVDHVLRADELGGRWSWNNPPLYYWLAAIPVYAARLVANMTPMLALSAADCMKTVQVMQVMLTLLFAVACLRFMRRLGLDGRWLAFAGLMMTTIPCLYYASFRLGNDVLMSLFAMLAFIRLTDWWKRPSLRNSGMVALYAGLAGLTKTNGVLVAAIAFVIFMARLAIWMLGGKNDGKEGHGLNAGNGAPGGIGTGAETPVMTHTAGRIDGDGRIADSRSDDSGVDGAVVPSDAKPDRNGNGDGDGRFPVGMRWSDWLKDAVMFAFVFIPLGLGYQIYERVRFGVPFFYVQRPFYPWDHIKGDLEYRNAFYNGFAWYDRLVGHDCLATPQPHVDIDFEPCITTVAVKTYTTSFFRPRSAFMLACQWFAYGMGVVMSVMLAVCMLGMLAYAVRMMRGNGFVSAVARHPGWLVAGVAVLVWLPFWVYCCYREPVASTPHVRYIMMLFPMFIACVADACRKLMSYACDAHMMLTRTCHVLGWMIVISAFVFAVACMMTVLTLTVHMGTGVAFTKLGG